MAKERKEEKHELVSIIPVREEHGWHFQLMYRVEKVDGEVWLVTIDNVANPFRTNSISIEFVPSMYNYLPTEVIMHTLYGDVPVYRSEDGYFYREQIIKSAKKQPKKITLEDIEKKFGCPVEIVKGE